MAMLGWGASVFASVKLNHSLTQVNLAWVRSILKKILRHIEEFILIRILPLAIDEGDILKFV
jgi:hypothetical protein